MQPQRQEKQDYLRDEEVDFSFLFRKAQGVFERIGNGISNLIGLMKKRFLLITLIVLTGLALGYAAYTTAEPYYRSSMTLVMANIRNEFVEAQLNNLNEMVEEDNREALASSLKISLDEASQIRSMEFTNLDEGKIAEDSVALGSPIRIDMTLYNNSLFPVMEPALVNFMEQNPFFARQKSITQREYTSMISKLKDQIASIDSVKATTVNPRGPVNGFVYGEALDPTELYREGINLYEQQVELESSLERLDITQVVNGFYPRSKPSGPNLWKYLLAGGFSFFLLGLIIARTLENRKH